MEDQMESSDTLEGQMRLWWFKACQWEGVSPNCSFVVFSSENPHQGAYDQAYRGFQESLKKSEKEE